MQPYRNIAVNQLLPLYWNGRKCSCESCLSLDQGPSSCSATNEAPRPSFTIESLLSRRDEPKPDLKQCDASSFKMALVPSGCSSATGQFTNADAGSELLHDHGSHHFLPQHFRRPPRFGIEQMSMFGRGNMQASGELTKPVIS